MNAESKPHSGLDFTQVPNDEQIVAAFKQWAMADADPATEWRIERAHARRLVEQYEDLQRKFNIACERYEEDHRGLLEQFEALHFAADRLLATGLLGAVGWASTSPEWKADITAAVEALAVAVDAHYESNPASRHAGVHPGDRSPIGLEAPGDDAGELRASNQDTSRDQD